MATRVIYASEYHYTIFQAMGAKGLMDASTEAASAIQSPMGIFMPPWTFNVWEGEQYLRGNDEQEIEQALEVAAGQAEEDDYKTSAIIKWNEEAKNDEPDANFWNRGTLFVYDPATDNLYLDYAAEYHVNILQQILSEQNIGNDPDRRFDFNEDYVFGVIRDDGQIIFYTGQPNQQDRVRAMIEGMAREGAAPELV